jgi:hypothetical protein
MSENKFYMSPNATRPLTLKLEDGSKQEFQFEKVGLHGGSMRGVFVTDNAEHQKLLDQAVSNKLILELDEASYQYWVEKKSDITQNSFQVTEVTGKKPEPPKPAEPAEDKSKGHTAEEAGATEKISEPEPTPAEDTPAEDDTPAEPVKKKKGRKKKE